MNSAITSQLVDRTKASKSTLLELERRVYIAIQRYSNVHRGAGQHAQISTRLYESAREIVLEYFGLSHEEYVVIFGNRRSLSVVEYNVKKTESTYRIYSKDLGLPIGVGALVVKRIALPRGIPPQRGGGIVKLVSKNHVIWKDAPGRYEAGTPNILGTIMLAVALRMILDRRDSTLFLTDKESCPVKDILYKDELGTDSGATLLAKLRSTLTGSDTPVPTSKGLSPYVNFDSAASMPTFEPVWQVVRRTWRQSDSVQRAMIDEVRGVCLSFFNAPADQYELIYTQNATEGVNLVSESLKYSAAGEHGTRLVVLNTGLEHNSNDLPWRHIPGVSLLRLPVDREGFIDLARFEQVLSDYNLQKRHGNKRVGLVAISACSNVVGTINDIERISSITHRCRAHCLVDAAQLAAHRRIDLEKWAVDYLVFSGHKLYAPFGAGALIYRRGSLKFDPDTWKQIRSSGCENAVGIAAMGKAMELLRRVGLDLIEQEEWRLTRSALHGLCQIAGVEVFGALEQNTERFDRRGPLLAFSLRKVHHNLVAKMLAEMGGIGVRSGCFCAHLFVKTIMGIRHIQSFFSNLSMLVSQGPTSDALPGVLRVSFSIATTQRQVDSFIQLLKTIAGSPLPLISQFFSRLYYGTPILPKTAEQEKIIGLIDQVEREVYGFSRNDA
jgi:selenocysteine lyase/cysteine desulfurase